MVSLIYLTSGNGTHGNGIGAMEWGMGVALEQWNGEWEGIECEAGPFPIWWRPHVIHPIPWSGVDKEATRCRPRLHGMGSVIRTALNVLLLENGLGGSI